MMAEPPELPGVRHEYVDAGGLRMHVAVAGPADAPPVLLVHGWPQNWWTWRHVIPTLAERFRVIAPDLRGHGWSEAPATGYEKEQLASDLLAVLDGLAIERATWIGHDWGGWTGFLAALRAPERIERMLALCILHPWIKPDPRRLAVLLSYQGPISLPVVGRRVAGPMVRALLQTGRGPDRLDPGDVALFAEHIPLAVTVAMYRTFLTREMVPIARGRYASAALEVPTTLILGRADAVTKGTASGPVEGQPRLHVETLDRVAHWVPEQRPQAIIDWASRANSDVTAAVSEGI
jgi:pimeloyl-ACP methyl ester carboxylesterase